MSTPYVCLTLMLLSMLLASLMPKYRHALDWAAVGLLCLSIVSAFTMAVGTHP